MCDNAMWKGSRRCDRDRRETEWGIDGERSDEGK
jgi:hypothetical protein